MNFRLKRINLILIAVIFLMFTIFISLGHSTNQLTFILDPNNPVFMYEEHQLNDTASYQLLEYTDNDNITVWISIPKNSAILFSNISLRGESTPIKSIAKDFVQSIAVGNVIITTYENEIAVGTLSSVDLLDSKGNQLWSNDTDGPVSGIDIGNVTADDDNEIAAASQDKNLYLLRASDGIEIWRYTGTNNFNGVAIGNVTLDSENEILAGDNDKNVTLLNSQGQVVWYYNRGEGSILSVDIGDVNITLEGNEVVASDNQAHLYLINSTGQFERGYSPGGSPQPNIVAVAVGDVNISLSGDEIAAATDNGKLYLLDAQLNEIWNYPIGNSQSLKSVAIGNITIDPGNEIVIGSSDNNVYVLNSTGQLILSYGTSQDVEGVSIGNLTVDPGNEVIAGSLDGNIYILNFEYYPTNAYLDIRGNGNKDWQHKSSKLRNFVNITGSNINSEIQSYLSSDCASQVCNVPFVFHSDSGGHLNITSINITYDYSASEAILNEGQINAWSRTNNVEVNESVGNQSMNISYYAYPANDIEIRYIEVDSSATICDFNGKQYPATATVCDLSGNVLIVNKSGTLPSPSLLWDNSMSYNMPIWGKEDDSITTVNGRWMKNFTIWNETEILPEIFYNVTANISIDSQVTSNEGLFVEWNNNFYDITPSIDCPEYENKTFNGDDFYVCKQDSDGNNVANFFKVKQPHTSTATYTVNGSINSLPVLSNFDVQPQSDIWGSNFIFSVEVYDYEGNNVTVNLWVYHVNSGVWEVLDSKNTTSDTTENETIIFDVSSTQSWIGENYFLYEYRDFSGSEYLHPAENTTVNNTGPYVQKHDVSIILIEGDGASVNRMGSDSTNLKVVVTDINWNQNVSSGVNCNFWITTNGVDFNLANSTTTDSSGFCNFTFDPDETYNAGQQLWKAEIYQDTSYSDNTSANFIVHINGTLGIQLIDQNFTRNGNSVLTAKLIDENNNTVAEPNYICTWYINNQYNGTSNTNNTGHCGHAWLTDCFSYLGSYLINVTLSGSASSYYTITNDESSTNVTLKGTLNVTIIHPRDSSVIYEKEDVALNSTVTDECLTQDSYSHNVTWYSPRKQVNGYWCPPSGTEIAKGINTTWITSGYVWWDCTPRPSQLIIANATGELYNSNEKNVSVDIWGFSDVEVTIPNDGEVLWRNKSYGSEVDGFVKIKCEVKSNFSDLEKIRQYPVNFWIKSMIGSFNSLGTNSTTSSGETIYWWNISLTEDYNYTIKCNISDEPSLYFLASVAEDNINVTPRGPFDSTDPVFLRISANSVEQYKENVTIEAEVFDAWGVAKVWVNITYPDGTNHTYNMKNVFGNTWNYSQNFTDLGDYDFTIYAKDNNNRTNSISSWFEVYPGTVLFYGNTTDALGGNVSVEFIFYRVGTSSIIHTNKTSILDPEYNFTIRKRVYDIEFRVFGHTIKFLQVNITNNTNDSIRIDKIPDQVDIPLIAGVRNRLAGAGVDSTLNFDSINLTLNFTGADIHYPVVFEPESIDIYQCSNWDFTGRTCSGGWINRNGVPKYANRIVTTNVLSLSGFVAGDTADPNDERCDPGETCEYDPSCCGGTPTPPSPGGGSPGGGGPSGVIAVCGNGRCEAGENSQNCPQDCGPPEPMFSVRTNMTEPQLNPGAEEIFALWVANAVNYPINTSISATGSIAQFITFEKDSLQVGANKEEISKIYVTIPSNADTGTYTGHITVTGSGKAVTLPVSLIVSIKGATYLDLLVESLNPRVGINETARFRVMLYNYGLWKILNLNLTYYIKDSETQEVFYEENEELEITQSKTLDKRISLSELKIPVGRYQFNVTVLYDSKVASSYDDFEATESFWTTDRIQQAIIVILIASSPIIVYYLRKQYIAWKLSKARYIFPLDFRKLPEGEIWLGKIAETEKKAYFNMSELRTHVLTAGATGSGKSVSAMIFVEELLRENIPVIVFDPTAQWSGFVRPCKDPNLTKFYKEFGMDKRDVKPYRGMIYEVTDPNVKIDFDKYMNPGEITVFMLNKLKPGQYDDAVRNIIDTIFTHGWEESTKLRMVVVFDEVHRLLEKYGGKGGYVSLEKACREFRKWGIGLIMASQVLSDFKEAIKGNVLTEIQLHTKSLGDLGRVEKKYGLEYTKRVTKLEVGVGMIQNPRYNKGRPWFVAFRPTLHEPHKIPDRDLETYKEYAAILASIEAKIKSMEKSGKDVFDLRTEFKLAQDKLKKGRFRMAKIYIDSLKKHLLEG